VHVVWRANPGGAEQLHGLVRHVAAAGSNVYITFSKASPMARGNSFDCGI
jgi:hypothetical protein